MRKICTAERASLKSAERDAAIARNFLGCFSAGSYFVYLSRGTEADTETVIRALLREGKRVCVPRLEGERMFAAPYAAEMSPNRFGILEPAAGDEPCEIAVVPLLAVDGQGYRLGYGGGYYDRYFARRPSALRVGLCYEAQLARSLPREAGDMPLHAVITEAGIRRFPQEADG